MRFRIGNNIYISNSVTEKSSGSDKQNKKESTTSISSSSMTIRLGNGKVYDIGSNISNMVRKELAGIGSEINSILNETMSDVMKGIDGTFPERNKEVPVAEEKKEYVPSQKKCIKDDLKKEFKKFKNIKFVRGQKYVIRHKQIRGVKNPVYEIRQIVWCMDDYPICGLVVKQISGHNMNKSCMSVHDCKNLHVKYEPGLYIMSMFLNWSVYKSKKDSVK